MRTLKDTAAGQNLERQRILELGDRDFAFCRRANAIRQYQFNQTNANAANDFVRTTSINVQYCPSDPNPPQVITGIAGGGNAAKGSYKGVAGRTWGDAPSSTCSFDDYKVSFSAVEEHITDRGPLCGDYRFDDRDHSGNESAARGKPN